MRTAEQEKARYRGLSTSAFGALLGVSHTTVRRLIEEGRLPEAYNVGTLTRPDWRIPADVIDRFRRDNSAAEYMKKVG